MKIKKWWFKNYKSYGNTTYEINLNTNKGELILFVGKNGEGKSSAISSLDLACYGEEINKKGKRLAKSNFPNRTNGQMTVGVEFETDQLIHIERKMDNVNAPIKTKVVIDGIPEDKALKLDAKIQEKIGFDFDTYKSFISMNINNFKNFISMTPDEKRTLLDKLFNLQQINELNKILKELQKNNNISFSSIKKEIDIYTDNIEELEETIKTVNEKNKEDNVEKIIELKETLETKKEKCLQIESEISKIDLTELQTDIEDFEEVLQKLKTKKNDIVRDIREINEKINLYKLGKCPTCLTELVGELNLLPEFEERLEKTNLIKEKTSNKIELAETEYKSLKEELKTLKLKKDNLTDSLNEIINESVELKTELKLLKEQKVQHTDEFVKNVDNLKIKKSNKETEYLDTQKLKHVYDMLLPLWGENGVKRDIIDSIIDPINQFIMDDLSFLKTRFKVEIDNNFDAHIYEWNNEIDIETLSTGEAKKINLIIMLAYIKVLRMKRDINVLFLDEVFASIDLEGIEDILSLFKKYANEKGINIILVHHAELKEWFFDRIVYIKKNTFSYIEEKIIE